VGFSLEFTRIVDNTDVLADVIEVNTGETALFYLCSQYHAREPIKAVKYLIASGKELAIDAVTFQNLPRHPSETVIQAAKRIVDVSVGVVDKNDIKIEQ